MVDKLKPWSTFLPLFFSLSYFSCVLLQHTRVSDKVFFAFLLGPFFCESKENETTKKQKHAYVSYAKYSAFFSRTNKVSNHAPNHLCFLTSKKENSPEEEAADCGFLRPQIIQEEAQVTDASGGTLRSSGVACYQKRLLVEKTINHDPIGFLVIQLTFVLSSKPSKTFLLHQQRSCPADVDFLCFVINISHM